MEKIDTYEIDLLIREESAKCIIELYEDDDNCKVALSFDDKLYESISTDYFDALQKIRGILESDEIFIQCNGARTDVYPSVMSRDMGLGLSAYVQTMGKKGAREDLVCIFDSSSVRCLGTVEDQEKYHRDWISRLGH